MREDHIPIVAVMSQLTGIPAVFARKEAKTYGTCKVAEGGTVNGLRVVGVEDVVTTGGALVNGCLALRDVGADLETVVLRHRPGTGRLGEPPRTRHYFAIRTPPRRSCAYCALRVGGASQGASQLGTMVR